MCPPSTGWLTPCTSKNRKPDCVECGSTAAAVNFARVSSSYCCWAFLFLFPPGKVIGPTVRGLLVPLMWATRRKTSSTSSASSLLRRAATSSARMLFTEIGWSPSLVITRRTGRISSSLKGGIKISAFGEVLYTSTAAVTCSLGCPSLQTYAFALLALGGMKSLKAQSATDENTMVRLTIHKKTRRREGIAGLSAIDGLRSTSYVDARERPSCRSLL